MRPTEIRFTTTIVREKERTFLVLPTEVETIWGRREHHYVAGIIAGHTFRGRTELRGEQRILPIGATWLRDNGMDAEATVECCLDLESPVMDDLPQDFASALTSEPRAAAFFEQIAPFYRKGYLRWIESAKRPETRSKRIAEAVQLLAEGHIQR
jgi:hypothetical protein